jgi:hypothetical protein
MARAGMTTGADPERRDRSGSRAHRALAAVWALLVGILLFPASGRGQDPAPEPTAASLEVDHWVHDLLDGASAVGLADVWLPGHRPVSAIRALAVLDAAIEAADDRPAWRNALSRARGLLMREHGFAESGRLRALPGVGLRGSDGPATNSREARGDAVRLGVDLIWRPDPTVALWASPAVEAGEDGVELPLPRLGAAWEGSWVRIEAAHQALAYGPGSQGSTVAGGAARLALLGVGLARPWEPGGWLSFLGRVDGSLSASRFGADDYGPAAGFVGAEVRVRPTDWLLLQLQRSAVIGWTHEGDHPGVRDLAYMLIGKHTPFDDQRFAMSARLHLRPFGVHVSPYMELGMEDSAGMLEDPGTVMGVALPSLEVAGAPMGVRYEYAAFGEDARVFWSGACCFEPRRWYEHSLPPRSAYVDGEEDLLGHPLGGYGHQHLLEVTAPLLGAGVWLEAGLFAREREAGNLLHDVVPGSSRGGSLDLRVNRGRIRADLTLVHESGDGWNRTLVEAEGTLLRW